MECRLMERECVNCGQCEKCDLDPEKVCDNCCKCIGEIAVDYASIPVFMPPTEDGGRKAARSRPRKRNR